MSTGDANFVDKKLFTEREKSILRNVASNKNFIAYPDSGCFETHAGTVDYVLREMEQFRLRGAGHPKDEKEYVDLWMMRVSLKYNSARARDAFSKWAKEFTYKSFNSMKRAVCHCSEPNLGLPNPQIDLILAHIEPRHIDMVKYILLTGIKDNFGGK